MRVKVLYRVAICEDEAVFRLEQEAVCRRIFEKLDIEYHISVFESGTDFLAEFSKGERYDFLLLDIIMDEPNGMELARRIREHDNDAAIVFLTSSPDYALQGYDARALHYLMKPLDSSALERLIASDYEHRHRRNAVLTVKSGAQNLRLPLKDIICLETVGRRVGITMPDETITISGKLSDLLEDLPKECFIRCHVGYAVNLENIRRLTRTSAVAANGKSIPVSRAYFKAVEKAFLNRIWDA